MKDLRSLTKQFAFIMIAIGAQAATTNSAAQTGSEQLFIYPRLGQSAPQQDRDRRECHDWAVRQTGYDPNLASGAESADVRMDYLRAASACLEGRGYTVK